VRIAIACPKGVRTGGPEALHQLFFEVRSLGTDAFLIDSGGASGEFVREYEKYEPVWKLPEDLQTSTHLVIPETMGLIPDSWKALFTGSIVVWWLSVDNSPLPEASENESKTFPLPAAWGGAQPRGYSNNTKSDIAERAAADCATGFGSMSPRTEGGAVEVAYNFSLRQCAHIAQSYYAQEWAKNALGIKPMLVTDYVCENVLLNADKYQDMSLAEVPSQNRSEERRVGKECPM